MGKRGRGRGAKRREAKRREAVGWLGNGAVDTT